MLRRALLLSLLALAARPGATAHAGVFDQVGPTITYSAAPGDVDEIAAYATPTTIRFVRFGGAGVGPGQNCVFVTPTPWTARRRA